MHPKATARAPNPQTKLEAVLEENPKWRLLEKVLAEVRRDYQANKKSKDDSSRETGSTEQGGGPTNVLVMVKDEKTLCVSY